MDQAYRAVSELLSS